MNIMKKLFGVALAAGFMGLGMAAPHSVSAAPENFPGEHLAWGQELASGEESCPSGRAVINIVQKVVNSVDSGEGGNNWAFDDYIRQIEVVDIGNGEYCATARFQGSFTTAVGTSPGNTGIVAAGVVGTFQGGYTAIITGDLLASPLARTRGSIGTFDYDCDIFGLCPGFVSWPDLYFEAAAGFAFSWWGWVYHAGNNGSWVNSVDGNSGDITGS